MDLHHPELTAAMEEVVHKTKSKLLDDIAKWFILIAIPAAVMDRIFLANKWGDERQALVVQIRDLRQEMSSEIAKVKTDLTLIAASREDARFHVSRIDAQLGQLLASVTVQGQKLVSVETKLETLQAKKD